MAEKVKLLTSDGIEIIGDFYQTKNKNDTAIIMLHMMPTDRSSWKNFAMKLQKDGFQSLAIDLRGHGESINQNNKTLNYQKFSDAEHQDSILDIEAAAKFFLRKGLKLNQILLIGASIGANLALEFQAENPLIKGVILLSPGLNYRGIETEPLIKRFRENQAVFIVVSEEDTYSADSARRLYELTQVKKELKILNNAGHGTTMLKKNETLNKELINWLLLQK